MGELGAFLRLERVGFEKRDPEERVHDYRQYFQLPDDRTLRDQGARCMDCGIPFCHEGCPLGNLIPDWNDLVYRDRWRDALVKLHATNNFPEFTGLICPAPCESACVLDINDDAVTIEQIELAHRHARLRGGLDRAGAARDAHRPQRGRDRARARPAWRWPPSSTSSATRVTVYERDEAPGGLLRFGVPDAKLEKWIIDRRVKLLEDEGIEFRCDVDVGRDVTAGELRGDHDARGRRDRLARAPRPRRARPRAGRRALRDGLPVPAQPRRGAPMEGRPHRADAARPGDQRRGQARGRGRRRRHRHGLHLERAARGRGGRAAARRLPAAARATAARRARPGRCRPSARRPPTRSTRAASAASARR